MCAKNYDYVRNVKNVQYLIQILSRLNNFQSGSLLMSPHYKNEKLGWRDGLVAKSDCHGNTWTFVQIPRTHIKPGGVTVR